ncbi:MAG: malectin domain-containing carbohydrate-binding protein, partial [Maribacter sp.]
PKLSAIEILETDNEEEEDENLPLLTRINSGGNEVTINGLYFESDSYFKGDGTSYSNPGINDILQTELDGIYVSERSTTSNNGTFEYAIPVTNGNYEVNLHFAEIFFGATNGGPTGVGKRIFDVSLEGNPILIDFDVNQEVGPMTAVVKSYETSVSDGELSLVFSATINQPKLSAIELFGNGEIIEVFDACEWRNLADAKEDHIEGQSATVNGKLYTMSGLNEKFQAVEATEIYDPASNTWSFGEPMPLLVTHGGMAVVNDEVWIIGGFAGNHPGVATDRVQIYNSLTDTWREGPKLPGRRGSGAATLNQGKVHFFGGLLPDRDTDVGEHYFYDLSNETAGWQSAAPLPSPRNHLGGTSNNGLVYAIGGQIGHDKGASNQKFVHAYNPKTDSWTRLQDLPSNRSHFEVGTISHKEKVIIAGGNRGADNILEFDPISNEWTELCKLPEPLLTPTIMVWENRLIITGGGAPNNRNPTNKTRWIPIEKSNETINLNTDLNDNEQVILLYPNPVEEDLNIKFKNLEVSGLISLMDFSGRLLNTYKFDKTTEYSVKINYPEGIYFIKVVLEKGNNGFFKIIKK